MIKYIIIGLLIAASFVGGFFVNRTWDSAGNSQLTQQIQVIQTEKDKIDAERSVLRDEIRKKDELAAVKELEVAQLHSLISAKTQGLSDEQAKITEAISKYQAELADINNPVSTIDRCIRLCKNRSELGYPCTIDFCNQYQTKQNVK